MYIELISMNCNLSVKLHKGLFALEVFYAVSVITIAKVMHCPIGDNLNLRYSDDNKKNTLHTSGNNGHGLKNVARKQTLIFSLQC